MKKRISVKKVCKKDLKRAQIGILFFWWIKIIKIDFVRKILNIFFWICEKKVVYKKIWKKYRFWKKIGVWEWILGRLVGSGGQKWGFGPPKRGQNGIFCSALGFCAVRDPPLGGPKTGYRGSKIDWLGEKMVKNGEKWEKTIILALRRRRRPQTGTRSSFFGGKIYDFRFFYEKWGWKSLYGLKKWVTTV